MQAKRSLEMTLVRWSRIVSLIGLVGLLLLALITVFEVLSRSILGIPVPGVADVSSLVIAVAVSACYPLVFAKRGNINVQFVMNLLGPRGKAILEVFGTAVSTFVFCLLVWQFLVYCRELVEGKATTWIVLWPTAPWWYLVTALIAFTVLIQLALIFIDLRAVFRPKPTQVSGPQKNGKAGEV